MKAILGLDKIRLAVVGVVAVAAIAAPAVALSIGDDSSGSASAAAVEAGGPIDVGVSANAGQADGETGPDEAPAGPVPGGEDGRNGAPFDFDKRIFGLEIGPIGGPLLFGLTDEDVAELNGLSDELAAFFDERGIAYRRVPLEVTVIDPDDDAAHAAFKEFLEQHGLGFGFFDALPFFEDDDGGFPFKVDPEFWEKFEGEFPYGFDPGLLEGFEGEFPFEFDPGLLEGFEGELPFLDPGFWEQFEEGGFGFSFELGPDGRKFGFGDDEAFEFSPFGDRFPGEGLDGMGKQSEALVGWLNDRGVDHRVVVGPFGLTNVVWDVGDEAANAAVVEFWESLGFEVEIIPVDGGVQIRIVGEDEAGLRVPADGD